MKTNIIKIILSLLLFSAVAFASDPKDLIKQKDLELKALLSQKNVDNAKAKVLINSIFDFEELGRKALSSSVWKSISDEQKASFVMEFRRMVENYSTKKLDMYKSDSTTYDETVMRGEDKAKVITYIWNNSKESVLEYQMLKKDDKWLAYDLVIDDMSTVRNYRDNFKEILVDKDFDELIKIIKEKADENQ